MSETNKTGRNVHNSHSLVAAFKHRVTASSGSSRVSTYSVPDVDDYNDNTPHLLMSCLYFSPWVCWFCFGPTRQFSQDDVHKSLDHYSDEKKNSLDRSGSGLDLPRLIRLARPLVPQVSLEPLLVSRYSRPASQPTRQLLTLLSLE